MGTPSPEIITEWMTEEADNQSFKPLSEVVQRVLSFRLKETSPEDNAELAERLLPSIVKQLEARIAEDRAEGIASGFQISNEGDYFRILAAPEMPLLIKLRAKEPEHFETFCTQILTGLGSKSYSVGGWKDGGVDFIAINLQLSDRIKYAPRNSQTVVIGQAKRYKEDSNITELMLRQFIGGAILRAAKIREENKTDAGLLTPVIYAYWTTSDFHHEARKYAKAMGMWYLSGVGVTQLALRAGVNLE